ncbi:hypothetical protein EEX84_15350 [Planococcus salinus]|uniref:Uncharacterized protein n=1 Tax=Planococcus salinus TaxID=1848460 RepID=A0A3M8P4L9_9BACL|nr:hypothetical protein EEX84_15350 [Planococcus salinus]
MEQNSEDALGIKRSAEIHSGEVERDRVSSARAKCGRMEFGRRFATKQRSDAGARFLASGAVLRNIDYQLI